MIIAVIYVSFIRLFKAHLQVTQSFPRGHICAILVTLRFVDDPGMSPYFEGITQDGEPSQQGRISSERAKPDLVEGWLEAQDRQGGLLSQDGQLILIAAQLAEKIVPARDQRRDAA